MRQVDLTKAAGDSRDPARVARLTRHLKARLEDFGPGGPQVVSADEEAGAVTARFPGRDTAQVLRRLGCIFYLQLQISFIIRIRLHG